MEEKPPYKPSQQTYSPPQEYWNVQSHVYSPLLAILTPWSRQLIAFARQINDQGQHQFAVVLAHAACEWATEDALVRLLRHRGLTDNVAEPIVEVFTTTSFTNRQLRKLFTEMTGAEPQKEKWWDGWLASRGVRHSIAHRGLAATPEQALDALSLAESCVSYIAQVVERVVSKQVTP